MSHRAISPRRFLHRTSAMGAVMAAPYIIPSGVLARNGKPGHNDQIGIAGIGIERRGRQVLDQVTKQADVRMIGIADANLPRAEANNRRFGGQVAVQDYRRILERDDVVAIVTATPDHWRALVSIHSAQADKDIYAEKPMTLTILESHSRRQFLKNTSSLAAGGVLAGTLPIAQAAHVAGSDVIKIGLVGCGGRGTGAAANALSTDGATKLVAMADAFEDQLQRSHKRLLEKFESKVEVPTERQFVGFDAYQRVLESDIDLVILTTSPGFRPQHFEAAIKAGKHVFMEKPVAVDAAGVRRVLATNEIAKEKGLAVAVGLHYRHELARQETIQRLHDGLIGQILSCNAYFNSAGVWVRPRKPEQTEMEYQMRNWFYFNWLCGDHIVEQHIHNLDIINWAKQAFPVSGQGMGGRQVRTGIDYGQIFDHHFVEFTYADGSVLHSQCRHIPGCWTKVGEEIRGTKGMAIVNDAKISNAEGREIWSYGRGGRGGHQQEHDSLFSAIRAGEVPNEGEYGAMSTMTAILGRMATYSGKMISMEEALSSKLDISPVDQFHSFTDTPPVVPDDQGRYPVAVPGKTKVV